MSPVELQGHAAQRALNLDFLREIRDSHEAARVAASVEAADATRAIADAANGGGPNAIGDPRYARAVDTAVTALQRALRSALAVGVCEEALELAAKGGVL
jgi:hypothetical protein